MNLAGCCVYLPVQKGTRICLYSLCASSLRLILARCPRRPPAESRARREPALRLACTAQHELSPVQERKICLIARLGNPTTRKTPWPSGGPRCSARERLGPFQTIERRLQDDPCQAVSPMIQGFLELFVAAQAPQHRTPREVRKLAFRFGIPACYGSLEKAAHGNLRYLLRA